MSISEDEQLIQGLLSSMKMERIDKLNKMEGKAHPGMDKIQTIFITFIKIIGKSILLIDPEAEKVRRTEEKADRDRTLETVDSSLNRRR